MSAKWEIEYATYDPEKAPERPYVVTMRVETEFICLGLGQEWLDFPYQHKNCRWLGRWIKHAALMTMSAELHSTFCQVCDS